MRIRVNFFFCDTPELFLPLKDWAEYFPDDGRPDELKEYDLHLTEAQLKGLLKSNTEISHDLADKEDGHKADKDKLVEVLEKFIAKLKENG